MSRLVVVALAVATLLGCGADPAPLAELTPSDAEPAPAPVRLEDAGPGELPAPVAEALGTAFPQARRVRCAVPEGLPGDGDLSAVSFEGVEGWLVAPTIAGGWFGAVVPTATGSASVLRGDVVVGVLSWSGAEEGAWRTCTLAVPKPFGVFGLVEDGAEQPVAGVTVRACDGAIVQANGMGRFEVQGQVGHPCTLLAWQETPGGFVRSELHVVESEGQDAIVEIVLDGGAVSADAVPDAARRMAATERAEIATGVTAELAALEALSAGLTLSPEAKAVVDGWKADLGARKARREELAARLDAADRAALLAGWAAER